MTSSPGTVHDNAATSPPWSGIAAGVALFSFIGVEAAAVTAKRVKNPRRNVGRASVLGTAASAMLYVLVTAAVMGLVAHHTLTKTGAPFVNAFQSIFPHSAWAGQFIAAVAVISGIGALNGWTLIVPRPRGPSPKTTCSPGRSRGPTATGQPGSASWSGRCCRRCSCCGATTRARG